MRLSVGMKAPAFTLPRDGGDTVSLKDFLGQKVIVYFYPGDGTLGCTAEACAFRDAHEDLNVEGIKVIGISRDSVESHNRFKERHNLNFILASDESEEVCRAYGVLHKKAMLRLFELERATFLIDENGHIAHIWRKVFSFGHVKRLMRDMGLV